jgi:hypothetical protein
MIGEIAKAKQLKQPSKTHDVAKRFRRNLFNFNEDPSSQLNEIFLNLQELNPEQNLTDNCKMFE